MSNPYTPKTGNRIIRPGNVAERSLSNSNISRVLPRQLSSGSTRGTQIVGYGNTKIDGSNNTITIAGANGGGLLLDGNDSTIVIGDTTNNSYTDALVVVNTDGSVVGMGKIPDDSGDFGFFSVDTEGFLLFKIVGSTQYWYDKAYNTNNMQAGLLPDATYNIAVAKPGNNVSAGFP